MINRIRERWYQALMTVGGLLLPGTVVLAQDKKLDVDVKIGEEPVWYERPWVWVVGAAIFILILAAILRSGSRKST